ncbi:homeobox protein abdominal-B-like, partial [Rhagoletis pomonella]|uniref:homeobox protein abdominal-B-like n=1 Tax=Rhagoletis pomonella TaxID=28610 RepID=UPI00177FB66D
GIFQHALLPPPLSPPLESQQPQHQEAISPLPFVEDQQSQLVEQQQQQLQTHQCAFNDTSTIADIIDASALEAVTGEAILSADITSTSQQQPHNQQQQQRSQDQEQQPESLSGAQCSSLSVIGEVPAGSSALTERNKTSPTSLPLLLQEEEDEEADTGNEARASKSHAVVAASAANAAVALTSTTIFVLL